MRNSWIDLIQINYEVTKTMPSQQEIRAAFSRLISPLKVADEAFKFHQDLIVSQTFETQRVSDDEVLKYFQQTEEKIHSMDTRKQLKFPDRAPPSKTNAINSGDGIVKSKGKGNQKSQSVPPAKNDQQNTDRLRSGLATLNRFLRFYLWSAFRLNSVLLAADILAIPGFRFWNPAILDLRLCAAEYSTFKRA